MYTCRKCEEFVELDHLGEPHCRCRQKPFSRSVGAIIIVVSLALLVAMRVLLGPEESCERDTSVVLKGTFADCEARNAAMPIPESDAKQAVAAR